MSNEIRIQIASDSDHEKVCAEIYVGDRFVALLSQEAGPEALEVEFPGPGLAEDHVRRRVDLSVFLDAVGLAARRLAGEP